MTDVGKTRSANNRNSAAVNTVEPGQIAQHRQTVDYATAQSQIVVNKSQGRQVRDMSMLLAQNFCDLATVSAASNNYYSFHH